MNTNYNYIFLLMIKHTTSKEEVKQIMDDWNWWTWQELNKTNPHSLEVEDEPLTLTTVYEEK